MVKTKPITASEILNNQFAKTVNGTITIKHPTKEQALKMSFREICVVFFGSESLKFRPLDKAVENANCWLEDGTKEHALELLY